MKKMKLYKAVLKMDVLFFASVEHGPKLADLAKGFLIEELGNRVSNRFTVSDVDNINQVPEGWRDAFIWGVDDEITAERYFAEQDVEYKEYLRLKEKFEPNE